jgi:hypothetical protein
MRHVRARPQVREQARVPAIGSDETTCASHARRKAAFVSSRVSTITPLGPRGGPSRSGSVANLPPGAVTAMKRKFTPQLQKPA